MPTQLSGKKQRSNTKPHGRNPARQWLIALIGAFFLLSAAHAQFNAKCPAGGLSLDQVVRFSTQKVEDERVIAYIQRCQVSFTLDTTSLDRLIQAGASGKVLDAINTLTASQLTREQAQAQVDSIEQRFVAIDASVDAERAAALQKLDTAFQAERQTAAHIEPKGPFEPTADFNRRVQDNKTKLDTMDAKHEQDRQQLTDSFDIVSRDRCQPYQARADFLKRATYPESRPLIYTSYNPDTQVLLATIGNKSYGFYHVAPANAEALFKNWNQVHATQPLAEDNYHTRILTLASPSISAAGVGIDALKTKNLQDEQKKTEAMLAEANRDLDANDFLGANRTFLAVLARDPNNKAARDGLAMTQGAFVYRDSKTHLIWSRNDNGADINWPQASAYCSALDTGGFHDWRMPSLAELKTVYNRNVNRKTAPLPKDIHTFLNGVTPHTFSRGTTWPYYIEMQIQLTQTNVWTSVPPKTSGDKEASAFSFNDGVEYRRENTDGTFQRALCVRAPTSTTAISGTSQPIPTPQKPAKPVGHHSAIWTGVVAKYAEDCDGGNAKSCRLLGSCLEHGNGVDKDQLKSIEFYEKSCGLGDRFGCTLAKYMHSKIEKEKHP